ncbi:hypothetical protein CTAYLR_010718 [Chrysophaeum taylorii]|uniref:Uncharacterized protein n=1 Tax=Chrysophaeum taylorii TaxID=2483200 RepID=A0AAD7U7J8_9STRA|nr:hypothetical protein CTAYLR_010718 [Chrysophaeum taylorii]
MSARLCAAAVAFAPPLAATVVVVSNKEAHLMVCALVAAFLWFIAMFGAAIVLLIVRRAPLWFAIGVTVLAQECGRFGFVGLYRRAAPHCHEFPLEEKTSALAAGVGVATIHAFVVYGTAFEARHQDIPSAVVALVFAALDVVLTCLAFQRGLGLRPAVVLVHLAAAAATTAVDAAKVPLVILVLFLATALLWFSTRARRHDTPNQGASSPLSPSLRGGEVSLSATPTHVSSEAHHHEEPPASHYEATSRTAEAPS